MTPEYTEKEKREFLDEVCPLPGTEKPKRKVFSPKRFRKNHLPPMKAFRAFQDVLDEEKRKKREKEERRRKKRKEEKLKAQAQAQVQTSISLKDNQKDNRKDNQISPILPKSGQKASSFYSQSMTTEQQNKFAEILHSPELLRLDTEIARIKTLASNLDVSNLSEKNVKLLISVHDLISRMVATRTKILYGEKHNINIKNVTIIMRSIVQIIEARVLNPAVREQIARDFKNLKLDF